MNEGGGGMLKYLSSLYGMCFKGGGKKTNNYLVKNLHSCVSHLTKIVDAVLTSVLLHLGFSESRQRKTPERVARIKEERLQSLL